MNILFFLVHPAKFNFHRVQINGLISRGHNVEILITSKDILEDLVKEEGWAYTNIFPEGRKIPGLHVYVAAVISLVRTVYRLWKFSRGKKYDLFIGDLLTILGRLKGVPSLYPTDDVLVQVPEQSLFLSTCNHIIGPEITDLGRYNSKKIAYDGYKALAHLHPNHFKPERSRLKDFLLDKPFFLIRCVGFSATHDIGRNGINNEVLKKLVHILKSKGRVLITSERALPKDLEKYRIESLKTDISHYMYFAELFIGDSTTMGSEAAVLGTPSIEFDDYFDEIGQMQELEHTYGLNLCVKTSEPEELFKKVKEFINTPNLIEENRKRCQKLVDDKIDVSAFLIWFMENYPESVSVLKKDPAYQYRFK